MMGKLTDKSSVLAHVIALLLDEVAVAVNINGSLVVDIVNVCGLTTVVT